MVGFNNDFFNVSQSNIIGVKFIAMNIQAMKDLVGKPLTPSEWKLVGQSRINDFADATEDHQYIHVDEERAKDSWLGGTVAHGFLVLSLLPKLAEGVIPQPDNIVMCLNYGFDKVRFISPVKSGDEIRLCATVADVVEKGGGRYLQKLTITIEIKGKEKPAIACEWLNMFVCD